MKRLALFLAFFMCMGLRFVMAQNVQITGTVTSAEDNQPLPGASIMVKGTNIGTTTNFDGKYSLSVPTNAQTLVINFVGFQSQEIAIGGRTVIDIVLQPSVQALNEVVVTALGIRREQKSLGYSTTTVNSADVTKGQTVSITNALQGKVAGVNISSGSGAPGASTKVIIRGYSSISGNNQPLYIVDGIPVNNSSTGYAGINGVTDFGNGANDLNPEDVESVSIMKGAGATAIYGSRAANGVILITTKSGNALDKIRVDVNSSTLFSDPLRLPQPQNIFGQGWDGWHDLTQNGSWGPIMDGKDRVWGNVVDNSQLVKPYTPHKMEWRDFYDRGLSLRNSVSVSGGTNMANYYASYENTNENGIVPGNVDINRRNSFDFKGSLTGKRLTSTVSINYINRKAKFVPGGQGGSDNGAILYDDILQIPTDFSIVDMKDYNNKFFNLNNYFTPYAGNPYFDLSENGNNYNEDRVLGNVNFNYKINDWASVTLRLGNDVITFQRNDWIAIAIPDPNGYNKTYQKVLGSVSEEQNTRRETTGDLFVQATKQVTPTIGLDGLAGFTANERYSKDLFSEVKGLDIPNYYNLANSSATPTTLTQISRRRYAGLYAQVTADYRRILFVTLTGRNDWSSTLPVNNSSYFYPGVNASFILSDAFPSIQSILPFAKIRSSYGKAGNDANPYLIYSVFNQTNIQIPFGNLNFPLTNSYVDASGHTVQKNINGFTISNRLGNLNLTPEITTEFEIGTELRLLANRIGIDFSYYNRKTTNLILNVDLPTSSGYTTRIMNIGEIQNRGVELALNLTPVKLTRFQWDFDIVYTRNRGKVVKLTQGLDRVDVRYTGKNGFTYATGGYDVDYDVRPGYPLALFEGPVALTDGHGHIVVDAQGYPRTAVNKGIYGSSQPDFVMGFTNNFRLGNFNLSFTFDWRKGGLIYSSTADIFTFAGNATTTTYNYRQPFVVPNSVVETGTDNSGNPIYAENTTPITMSTMDDYYYHTSNKLIERNSVLNRSYLKLREFNLTYTIGKNILRSFPVQKIDIGIVGRNLLLWTPKGNDFIDPENTTFGNDLAGDFGEFRGGPSVRSYGLNVRITF